MSEIVLLSSFILLVFSFFTIRRIFSEYILGVAVALSLYPIVKGIDSVLAATVMVSFVIFELITLNSYYHYKKKFNTKASFKTALTWLAICLTIGTSLIIWALKRETGVDSQPIKLADHWWKVSLVLAMIICSGVKPLKAKGRRHG